MLDRPDAILLVIPLFAVGGFALRMAILSTGLATGLLAFPLGPVGFVVAGTIVAWELFTGTAVETDHRDDPDSTGLFGR